MTHDGLRNIAKQMAEESRASQGLPASVADQTALAQVAALVKPPIASSTTRKHGRKNTDVRVA